MADNIYLLVDFGSTYTKIVALDVAHDEVLGWSQSPTTAHTTILDGLREALGRLTIRGLPVDEATIRRSKKLASSSAAGGLRIVAVGLVPDLTLEAAQKAALGAGARIVGSFSYELDAGRVRDVEGSGCDIVLLVGGTDGGNKDVILHNARMLASTGLDVPFVVAGNRVVAGQVGEILESAGKHVEKVENVLPQLDCLNVEPTRACIRDIFMKQIVHAKGLDKAQEYVGDILMPTPMATLRAASLLAGGAGSEAGLGELMVVEVGGATTNVHSVATGYARGNAVKTRGIPEPYEKRTVEGDLGIRHNAVTILNLVGARRVLSNMPEDLWMAEEELEEAALFLAGNVDFVPTSRRDLAIDAGLARSAVEVAVERHAGVIKETWGPTGEIRIQEGKDLTNLKIVVGTGGVFAHNPASGRVLEAALFNPVNPFSLKPRSPELFIDAEYLLYGIGLLSSVEPEAALRIAKKHLAKLYASFSPSNR